MNQITHSNQLLCNPKGHIVIIDAEKAKNIKDFLNQIWPQLHMPHKEYINYNAFLDWMRDLDWLQCNNISIIIFNFESLFDDAPEYKKEFENDFNNLIFPFWNNDYKEVNDDEKYSKNITLYCINKNKYYEEIIEILQNIKHSAYNGYKIPHFVSCPMLRMYDGELYFASFVTYYNGYELKSSMIKAPSMWLINDIKTGNLIKKYCPEQNKNNKTILYNIHNNQILHLINKKETFLYMMQIRQQYIESGKVNIELYKEYYEYIINNTPSEYQTFFQELDNIINNK